jgi:ribosomal protein S6--L-glutamate ligase
MPPSRKPQIFGRKEWVALPDLGLPAIKAKVDTGARTSALHADGIEAFGTAQRPMVRFTVHPLPLRPDIAVKCSARVLGEREVTSSNGEKERRFIIETKLRVGEREWPIEVGLTNRGSMAHRMLLGRQAIPTDFMVDPASAYNQPKLGARAYRTTSR